MLTPNLFEELLAAYPAEKRDLARQVYIRFADGDSTQFFSQLFIVLDIYAHYYDRIPQTVIDANQSAHANVTKLRDEIALLVQGMDRRNLNIAEQAERTDEFCQQAITACNETAVKVQVMAKDISAQINVKAIVDGVRTQIEKGVQDEVLRPFMEQTQALAKQVAPAMKEIKQASVEAHTLWMKHIWKTAWTGSFLVTSTLFLLAAFGIYQMLDGYAGREIAKHIANIDRVGGYNQDAFRQLLIARTPVKVVRTTDTNGLLSPGGFALMIPNADGAEMRQVDGHNNGMIFFSSRVPEDEIQQVKQALQKLTNTAPNQVK
jgi:hypothetical protein